MGRRFVSNKLYFGDNLKLLKSLPTNSIDMIYIDPPFNTGHAQVRGELKYQDTFTDFYAFIEPRLREAHRVLKISGTLYYHIDQNESHRSRILLDRIFGEANYLNEIIWSYDYGGRRKDRWPQKHDNIYVYCKQVGDHYFDADEVERIPYMAPALCGPEKAAFGKLPTDVMWHTIVQTNSKEKTGYPTQKPVSLLKRFVQASCPKGGTVLDFFAGSGTIGEVCLSTGRQFILCDQNTQAIDVMEKRLGVQAYPL